MTATSFHLAIDDGGEFLVVPSTEVAIGHFGGGAAIELLADLRPVHARLRWTSSFHAGPHWRLEPEPGLDPPVSVHGQAVDRAVALEDGDEVRLSARVTFRFLLPEPASCSAQLHWLHGLDSRGATKVLLLVPGPDGRVRIGGRRRRHVAIAGLEHDVGLEYTSGRLGIDCDGGLRIESVDARNPDTASTNKWVSCPPSQRIALRVNARPSGPLPFGLSLAPVAGPG